MVDSPAPLSERAARDHACDRRPCLPTGDIGPPWRGGPCPQLWACHPWVTCMCRVAEGCPEFRTRKAPESGVRMYTGPSRSPVPQLWNGASRRSAWVNSLRGVNANGRSRSHRPRPQASSRHFTAATRFAFAILQPEHKCSILESGYEPGASPVLDRINAVLNDETQAGQPASRTTSARGGDGCRTLATPPAGNRRSRPASAPADGCTDPTPPSSAYAVRATARSGRHGGRAASAASGREDALYRRLRARADPLQRPYTGTCPLSPTGGAGTSTTRSTVSWPQPGFTRSAHGRLVIRRLHPQNDDGRARTRP